MTNYEAVLLFFILKWETDIKVGQVAITLNYIVKVRSEIQIFFYSKTNRMEIPDQRVLSNVVYIALLIANILILK